MPRRIDSKKDLISEFQRAVQDAREVADNFLLCRLDRLVDDVASLDDDFGIKSQRDLTDLLQARDVALDGARTREFIQKLGEAHFYAVCKSQGLNLDPVPETTQETPDFRSTALPLAHFEVKTPCVVAGERAIAAIIEDSFERRVALEAELASGQRIASSVQVVQPYGNVSLEHRVTTVIGVLQRKIRRNLKRGQFTRSPTYLIVSLAMLPTHGTTAEILRPTYGDHRGHIKCQPVTGELWMVAFSKPGMLIQSEPEFEGKSSIEGRIQSKGVLVDSMYVAGIIFLAYDLAGQCRPFALLRSGGDMTETIRTLVGNNWNDAQDSNGYALEIV